MSDVIDYLRSLFRGEVKLQPKPEKPHQDMVDANKRTAQNRWVEDSLGSQQIDYAHETQPKLEGGMPAAGLHAKDQNYDLKEQTPEERLAALNAARERILHEKAMMEIERAKEQLRKAGLKPKLVGDGTDPDLI